MSVDEQVARREDIASLGISPKMVYPCNMGDLFLHSLQLLHTDVHSGCTVGTPSCDE